MENVTGRHDLHFKWQNNGVERERKSKDFVTKYEKGVKEHFEVWLRGKKKRNRGKKTPFFWLKSTKLTCNLTNKDTLDLHFFKYQNFRCLIAMLMFYNVISDKMLEHVYKDTTFLNSSFLSKTVPSIGDVKDTQKKLIFFTIFEKSRWCWNTGSLPDGHLIVLSSLGEKILKLPKKIILWNKSRKNGHTKQK